MMMMIIIIIVIIIIIIIIGRDYKLLGSELCNFVVIVYSF
jgi:hypothetical protein